MNFNPEDFKVGDKVWVHDAWSGYSGAATVTETDARSVGYERPDGGGCYVDSHKDLCRHLDVVEEKEPPAPVDSYHERKFDQGKSRIDLIPGEALDALGDILAYGCAKYAEDSWKLVPDAKKRYMAALGRHYAAMLRGEVVDEESGRPHIEHLLTNAAFVTYFTRRGE